MENSGYFAFFLESSVYSRLCDPSDRLRVLIQRKAPVLRESICSVAATIIGPGFMDFKGASLGEESKTSNALAAFQQPININGLTFSGTGVDRVETGAVFDRFGRKLAENLDLKPNDPDLLHVIFYGLPERYRIFFGGLNEESLSYYANIANRPITDHLACVHSSFFPKVVDIT